MGLYNKEVRNMTKKEKREFAKDILIKALSVAYYTLEISDYDNISEEDKDEICKYINQYGDAMAKRIGKKYFTQ